MQTFSLSRSTDICVKKKVEVLVKISDSCKTEKVRSMKATSFMLFQYNTRTNKVKHSNFKQNKKGNLLNLMNINFAPMCKSVLNVGNRT